MGILLVCIVLIILGFCLKSTPTRITLASEICFFMIFIGTAFLIVSSAMMFIDTPIRGRNELISYKQNIAMIEIAMTNKQLTGEERSSALLAAKNLNAEIEKNRYWRDSFLFGWFWYRPIGDLALIDLGKIQKALTAVEVKEH